MKTIFPYEGKIDFDKYLDDYLNREDAIRAVPTDAELQELARKAIVREQLVLVPLPEGTKAQEGDTAVLRVESTLSKFNKERVTVTLGRGLYNRELEASLIGKAAGESASLTIQGEAVRATLLELKRKQAPAPTDEMVAALQTKDEHGQLITTVADYETYIHQQKTLETLATVNYYVMEKILADYPITGYDEVDIRVLGQLEKEMFTKLFRQEGLPEGREIPEEWETDMNVHSMDEFIAMRHDWYQIKIQQCLIYLNILDLPCAGKTDPLDHYEVLSELQLAMFQKIKEDLERRNQP